MQIGHIDGFATWIGADIQPCRGEYFITGGRTINKKSARRDFAQRTDLCKRRAIDKDLFRKRCAGVVIINPFPASLRPVLSAAGARRAVVTAYTRLASNATSTRH